VSRRTARLESEIREEIADVVSRKLKDPRLGFVTITRVEISPDLHYARVLVSVLGDDAARRKSLEGLRQAAGFVRRELGRRLRIRQTPELDFRADPGIDNADRVARLLEQMAPPPEAASDDDAAATAGAPGAPPGEDDEDP